jgi:DNA-binding XRE family transcriptional regulator
MKLRTERGIYQKEMAEIAGCSVWSYSRKEDGITPFKITEMENIQKHLNLPLGEIFLKHDSN